MEITAVIFAVMAAVLDLAEGAAVPLSASADIVPRTMSANTEVMTNLSSLFGWQLAGAAVNEDELFAMCNDISSAGHGDWAAMGLDPALITAPICKASHSDPDPDASLAQLVPLVTKIIISQLVASMNVKSLGHLCSSFKYSGIDNFRIVASDGLARAVCEAGHTPQPPRPFVDTPTAKNLTATMDVDRSFAWTYGLMYLAGAVDDTAANILCAHMPSHTGNIDRMRMSGADAQDAVCSKYDGFNDGVCEKIKEQMSYTFLVILENLAQYTGYWAWLCDNVNPEGMDAVSLNGTLVKDRICSDNKAVGA